MKKFLLTTLTTLAVATLTTSAQADTTLLTLLDAPVQYSTPYALSFYATDIATTVTIAGYQLPSFEYATDIGFFLGGSDTNLLAQNWSLVPATSGSYTAQYNDGTSVNALGFGATVVGDYDSYSQTIATTIGTSYTLDFLFTEDQTGPSGFLVTTEDVPEPGTLSLVAAGLFGLAAMRRRQAKATAGMTASRDTMTIRPTGIAR